VFPLPCVKKVGLSTALALCSVARYVHADGDSDRHVNGRPQIAAAVILLTIFAYLLAPVFVRDASTTHEQPQDNAALNLKQPFDPTTELPSLVRSMTP